MITKSGFLNFSKKTDYGLFLLVILADNDKKSPLSLREIAKKHFLSFFFLQKVALDLRKAGLIKAVRGKYGGYMLGKTPSKISIMEILEALEGHFVLMQCLTSGGKCIREDKCHVRKGFGMINELIVQTLSKFTLKDFINSKWQKKK